MSNLVYLIFISLVFFSFGCGVKGNPISPQNPMFIFSGESRQEYNKKRKERADKNKSELEKKGNVKK